MTSRRLTTIALALLVGACGGNGLVGPTGISLEFPYVQVPGCTDPGGPTITGAVYFILGLSSHVTNPGAPPPLEARMRVGETVSLSLGQGPPPGEHGTCGLSNSEQWTSTNPAVGALAPDPRLPYGFIQVVKAVAPGTFTVFVDFNAPDVRGQRYRTTLAYCSDEDGDGIFCPSPKAIGLVTVTP